MKLTLTLPPPGRSLVRRIPTLLGSYPRRRHYTHTPSRAEPAILTIAQHQQGAQEEEEHEKRARARLQITFLAGVTPTDQHAWYRPPLTHSLLRLSRCLAETIMAIRRAKTGLLEQ